MQLRLKTQSRRRSRKHHLTIGIGLWIFFLFTAPSMSAETTPHWDQPLDLCWVHPSDAMSSLSGASDNAEQFFLPQTPARLVSISLLGGDLLWSVDLGGRMVTSPVFTGGRVTTYSNVADGVGLSIRPFAIDSLSGVSRGHTGADIEGVLDFDAFVGGTAYLTKDGTLKVGSIAHGEFEFRFSREYRRVEFSDGIIFLWNEDGRAAYVEPVGGTIIEFPVPSTPSGKFAANKDLIFIGSMDGYVHAVDRQRGEIEWSSRTGGTIDHLQVVDRGILAASRDNFVYLLDRGNGGRMWKRKLAGRILGGTVLDRDYAAFLSYGSNEVPILDLDGGRLVNSVPVANASHFVSAPVAAGPLLLVPFDSGLAAFAPKNVCPKKEKDGK